MQNYRENKENKKKRHKITNNDSIIEFKICNIDRIFDITETSAGIYSWSDIVNDILRRPL